MDTIKSLGARIIELRKKNGISREELAKEFDIPCQTVTIRTLPLFSSDW